jgi:hypothetical protein
MNEHDFWLFREGERGYEETRNLWGRHDEAPLHVDDDLLQYLRDTLDWVPALDPSSTPPVTTQGLNLYGPTIINHIGGPILRDVCAAWSQLFGCGPARLRLCLGFGWGVLNEEELPAERMALLDYLMQSAEYSFVEVERDRVVGSLRRLAEYAAQAATGDYFIVHLGV